MEPKQGRKLIVNSLMGSISESRTEENFQWFKYVMFIQAKVQGRHSSNDNQRRLVDVTRVKSTGTSDSRAGGFSLKRKGVFV